MSFPPESDAIKVDADGNRYIKLNITWAQNARMLATIARDSEDYHSADWAQREIVRMGRIIDAYAAVCPNADLSAFDIQPSDHPTLG